VKDGDGLCHQPRAEPFRPSINPVLLIVRPAPPVTPFDMSIAVTDAAAIEAEIFADDAVPATRSDPEQAARAEATDSIAMSWTCLEFIMATLCKRLASERI
jgi:hypothetical protein